MTRTSLGYVLPYKATAIIRDTDTPFDEWHKKDVIGGMCRSLPE